MGVLGYKGVFSVISLVGFVMLVIGKGGGVRTGMDAAGCVTHAE